MWEVIIIPLAEGLHVEITDGKTRSSIGWVRYSRLGTIHKFTTFKTSLRRVIQRADDECARLNAAE
jgi:hypothetical protein